MLHIFFQEYPYGFRETFAEDELEFLAEREEKIMIYSYAKNTNIERRLPDNCELINLFNSKKRKRYFCLSILQMFKPSTFKEILFFMQDGYHLSFKNINRIRMYYEAKIHIMSNSFRFSENDIIYTYWLSEIAYPASLMKKSHPMLRFCSRAHGFDMYADRGYKPFRREVFYEVDQIHCINNSGKEDLILHYGHYLKKCKLFVSHLGVKTHDFLPRAFHNDSLVLVTCSNIIALKRLDILVKALSKLEIPIKWYHFGSGELYNDIIELSEKLLGKNVKYFFMGQTNHDELLQFYQNEQIDLFINSSDYEGVPVSIMEAMSYGIPCIARNVGGISELLNNSVGYLLDKAATEIQFCEAIAAFHSLPDCKKQELSRNAYMKIKQDFDMENNYMMFYDRLKEKGK